MAAAPKPIKALYVPHGATITAAEKSYAQVIVDQQHPRGFKVSKNTSGKVVIVK